MSGAIATARIETPVGVLTLFADARWLTAIRFARRGAPDGAVHIATGHPILAGAIAQLRAWFAGERTDFDLPLAPLDSDEGGRLREAIAAIPYGETRTYGRVADSTGSIARAVGQACKTNAFPIVIPCHRVVSTTGPEYYSGGDGPRTKSWLLDFEYAHLPPERRTRLI